MRQIKPDNFPPKNTMKTIYAANIQNSHTNENNINMNFDFWLTNAKKKTGMEIIGSYGIWSIPYVYV